MSSVYVINLYNPGIDVYHGLDFALVLTASTKLTFYKLVFSDELIVKFVWTVNLSVFCALYVRR